MTAKELTKALERLVNQEGIFAVIAALNDVADENSHTSSDSARNFWRGIAISLNALATTIDEQAFDNPE
jgi:hypothetical protein